MRRKEFWRNKHPDKAHGSWMEKDNIAIVTRFNNAWDELMKNIPHQWNESRGQASAAAGEATGGGQGARRWQRAAPPEPAAAPGNGPCPLGPHLANFDVQHGHLPMFFYSAQAHCVTCMSFYSSVPGFDLNCTSSGKTARGWAATATGSSRRRRRAVVIPDAVDAWLRVRNL
eukprot:s2112_g9.t1